MNRVVTMNISVLALVAGTVLAAAPAERDGQTALAVSSPVAEEPSKVARHALHRTVDLSLGESQAVELSDGKKMMLKLVGLEEIRDGLCSAVRAAQVKVDVNGQPITLTSATYHLPVTIAGLQID